MINNNSNNSYFCRNYGQHGKFDQIIIQIDSYKTLFDFSHHCHQKKEKMTEKEQKKLYGDVNFKLFCDFTVVTNRCLAETMVTMVIFVRVYLQHILCSKKI